MNKRLSFIKGNTYFMVGIVLVALLLLLCIFTSIFNKYDPLATDVVYRLQPPSFTHFMGTDDVGRDVFARAIQGIRISVFIGILVTAISGVFATFIGIVSAIYPIASRILMRIVDGIMAFPTIIFAIILMGVLGAGLVNIVVALSISYIPMIARVARITTLEVLSREYVDSVVVLGKSKWYIICKYILPNIIPHVMIQITYTFAMAILHESILSFLGIGIKVPTPSLGNMVSEGRNYISIAPWIITFPGFLISWIVLAVNMFGDGLREYLDPKHGGNKLHA